jgi:hypothetical protein
VRRLSSFAFLAAATRTWISWLVLSAKSRER